MAKSSDVLPTDLDECIDLYFACETADERDGFLQSIEREAAAFASPFLRAMMALDGDPIVRLRAASLLAKQGDAQALEAIGESLALSSDDESMRVAIECWFDVRGAEAAEALVAIFADPERGHAERRLAQDGLMAADMALAANAFVDLLESSHGIALDLLEGMLPALLELPACTARALHALEARMAAAKSARPSAKAAALQAAPDAREAALDAADELAELVEVLRSCHAALLADLQDSPHPSLVRSV